MCCFSRGHINIVSNCDITRDERKFATSSWDKNICVWDIATGTYRSKGPTKLCAGHEGSISCCKFSSDGKESELLYCNFKAFIFITFELECLKVKVKL